MWPIGVATFGFLPGSMLPFLLQRLRLDPTTSSTGLSAALVDVTGLVGGLLDKEDRNQPVRK
ncbi:MAG: hypothetical protein E6K70_22395 [Planctomycetota bacterium]|nr:MAG: hypothetical protein E6K70_22395 [Planctomycetota bacterium]